jgi:multidrug resistance efflux pump
MGRRGVSLTLAGALAALWGAPASAGDIGALGRIVPHDGIVTLVGAGAGAIADILVHQDQVVEAGEPLVIFTGKRIFELELEIAKQVRNDLEISGKKSLEIQEATLAQLRANAKKASAVNKFNVERAAEDAKFAAEGLARLLKSQAATYSVNLRSEKEHKAESSRIGLARAKAEAARTQTQAANSVRVAELELEKAKQKLTSELQAADLKIDLAEQALARVTLAAPSRGTILEVLKREGEGAAGPLIRLADLTRMAVQASIFQADVLRLKPGMKAKISSKALPQSLVGKLVSTGRQISDQGRVVPVMILLEEPDVAAKLVNLEVEVRLSDGR